MLELTMTRLIPRTVLNWRQKILDPKIFDRATIAFAGKRGCLKYAKWFVTIQYTRVKICNAHGLSIHIDE